MQDISGQLKLPLGKWNQMNVLSENDKQYHRVKVKLRTARNSQTNYQYWERTNQVIGKFNRTFKLKGNYLDKDTSENGVLKTTSFKVNYFS